MKYDPHLQDLRSHYRTIHFINLSMSALGIYEASFNMILTMMKDLGIENGVQVHIQEIYEYCCEVNVLYILL